MGKVGTCVVFLFVFLFKKNLFNFFFFWGGGTCSSFVVVKTSLVTVMDFSTVLYRVRVCDSVRMCVCALAHEKEREEILDR